VATGKSDMSLRVHEAAVELFSTRGYDGTSMRDIAKYVGVSVANIYNYTDSKELLFWTVMKETIDELMHEQRDALAQQTCSAGRFAAFAYTHARYHTKRAREVRLGNIPMESLPPQRADKVRAIRDEYEGMLRSVIKHGLDDHYLRTDNYVLASRAILQMGIGISVWFHPEQALTSDYVGNVYAAFAMAIVGYDADVHDRNCSVMAECRAVKTWTDWAPGK
jgi:AcrR family transcriptional regulator